MIKCERAKLLIERLKYEEHNEALILEAIAHITYIQGMYEYFLENEGFAFVKSELPEHLKGLK